MKKINNYFFTMFLLLSKPGTALLAFLAMIASYFAPIWAIGMVIIIFVVVDFLTGIWAAKTLKEKVVSSKMRNSVYKLIAYCATICLTFLIQEEIISFTWFLLTNVAAGLIVLTEMKSILENFSKITGNNIFNIIFEKINSLLKKKNQALENEEFKNGATTPPRIESRVAQKNKKQPEDKTEYTEYKKEEDEMDTNKGC